MTELVVQRDPIDNEELPAALQGSSVEGSATHLEHGETHYYFFAAADPLAAEVTDMRVGWSMLTGTGLDGLEREEIEALVVRARVAMDDKRAAACAKGCERSAFAIFSVLSATMTYQEAAELVVASVVEDKRKKRTRDMFSATSPWLQKLAPPEETAGGQRTSKRLRDKPTKEPK